MEKTLISRFQYENDIYSLYLLDYGNCRRYGLAHGYIWNKKEELDSDDNMFATFPESSKARVFTAFGSMLIDRLED